MLSNSHRSELCEVRPAERSPCSLSPFHSGTNVIAGWPSGSISRMSPGGARLPVCSRATKRGASLPALPGCRSYWAPRDLRATPLLQRQP
jgi:hypothetical protein